MKSKTIVILRGIGGNFKSSITKRLVSEGFVQIPECNRDFENLLHSQFNRSSDTILNYSVKHVVLEAFLNNDFDKYVSDRGLIDYGLMNEFMKDILDHYDARCSELNTEDLFTRECTLLNGYRVINILLLTEDRNFLRKIIDESFDTRACFFDNSEDYLKCQEMYRDFVMSHYNNVKVVHLNNVPDMSKYSELMTEYVNNITKELLEYINEHI